MDAKDVEIARLNAQLVIAKGLQSSTGRRKPRAVRSRLGLVVASGLVLGVLAGATGFGMGVANRISRELPTTISVPDVFDLR